MDLYSRVIVGALIKRDDVLNAPGLEAYAKHVNVPPDTLRSYWDEQTDIYDLQEIADEEVEKSGGSIDEHRDLGEVKRGKGGDRWSDFSYPWQEDVVGFHAASAYVSLCNGPELEAFGVLLCDLSVEDMMAMKPMSFTVRELADVECRVSEAFKILQLPGEAIEIRVFTPITCSET